MFPNYMENWWQFSPHVYTMMPTVPTYVQLHITILLQWGRHNFSSCIFKSSVSRAQIG